MRWRGDGEIGFKEPVAKDAEPFEHRSAKNYRIEKWCSIDVFDDIGLAGPHEQLSYRIDKARPGVGITVSFRQIGIGLAWWRGVNRVERRDKRWIERKRIGLNEAERISGLRAQIDADDLKSGSAVPGSGSAGAAKKIEKPRFTAGRLHKRVDVDIEERSRNSSVPV